VARKRPSTHKREREYQKRQRELKKAEKRAMKRERCLNRKTQQSTTPASDKAVGPDGGVADPVADLKRAPEV
jgi:hypothetical protein